MNPEDTCEDSGMSVEECQYTDICDCFGERVLDTTPELPPLTTREFSDELNKIFDDVAEWFNKKMEEEQL